MLRVVQMNVMDMELVMKILESVFVLDLVEHLVVKLKLHS